MRLTIIALVLIGLGALFISEDMRESRLEQQYKTSGEWAVVDAVDGYSRTVYENRKTHQITGAAYKADISYTTKAGQKVTALQQNLPPIEIDRINRGEEVTIQYLSTDPTTMRFPLHEYHSENRFVAWLVLILGLFLFYVARKTKKKSA